MTSFPAICDYEKLTALWAEYDPDGYGLIDPADIPFLIFELPGTLGREGDYEDILAGIRREHEEMQ